MPKFTSFRLAALCSRWVRRGFWLVALGSLSLSLTLWQGAVHASSPPSQYAPSQVNQANNDIWATVASARTLYEAGNYSAALERWQAIATGFEQRGDRPNQAMALSNLSLTYQAIGNWAEAKQTIDRAFELLPDESIPTQDANIKLLAQSLDVRGKWAFATSNPEAALADWQKSQQLYSRLNDDGLYVASLLNQAQAYQLMGQYLDAQRRLQQVPEKVVQSDDVNLKIAAGRSLAKIQRLLGDLADAKDTLACLLDYEPEKDHDSIDSSGQRFRSTDLADSLQPELPSLCIRLPDTIPDVDRAALWNDWGNLWSAIAQREQELGKPADKPAHKALSAYNKATELAQRSTPLYLQVQVNQLNLSIQFQSQLADANKSVNQHNLLATIDELLDQENTSLPLNQTTLYGRIHYAESLLRLSASFGQLDRSHECSIQSAKTITADNPSELFCRAAALLWHAVELADDQLGDQRAIAYATGRLGTLYVQSNQWDDAQHLFNQAIVLADRINAPDIGYRWQRQLGKLLETQAQQENDLVAAQKLREEAIVAYRSALATLGTVRSDLLHVDSEVQFSFRDEVKPVYREFIELLVKTTDDTTSFGQDRLREALQSFDNLQLAEINNFLGCNSGQRIQLEQIEDEDPKAVVIYSMLLDDEVVIILDPPRSGFKLFKSPRKIALDDGKQTDILEAIQSLNADLQDHAKSWGATDQGSRLYKVLIDPIEQVLLREAAQIQSSEQSSEEEADKLTLVFVLDDALRNVPMAFLNKDRQFLIQRYNIVLQPRIELFQPQPLAPELKILLGGVKEQPEGSELEHGAIRYLERELECIRQGHLNNSASDEFRCEELINRQEDIQAITSRPARRLTSKLNLDFTRMSLRQKLEDEDFSIVHLKTHGTFSSDPEKTFINGYGERIGGRQLGNLLQVGNPLQTDSINNIKTIDLLSFSACESADGDDRAVLGLTGVAVRAGARTVVASLWEADDRANTMFMVTFYDRLTQSGMTRAEAFATAQRALIGKVAPKEWAPYVLVGNWL